MPGDDGGGGERERERERKRERERVREYHKHRLVGIFLGGFANPQTQRDLPVSSVYAPAKVVSVRSCSFQLHSLDLAGFHHCRCAVGRDTRRFPSTDWLRWSSILIEDGK